MFQPNQRNLRVTKGPPLEKDVVLHLWGTISNYFQQTKMSLSIIFENLYNIGLWDHVGQRNLQMKNWLCDAGDPTMSCCLSWINLPLCHLGQVGLSQRSVPYSKISLLIIIFQNGNSGVCTMFIHVLTYIVWWVALPTPAVKRPEDNQTLQLKSLISSCVFTRLKYSKKRLPVASFNCWRAPAIRYRYFRINHSRLQSEPPTQHLNGPGECLFHSQTNYTSSPNNLRWQREIRMFNGNIATHSPLLIFRTNGYNIQEISRYSSFLRKVILCPLTSFLSGIPLSDIASYLNKLIHWTKAGMSFRALP